MYDDEATGSPVIADAPIAHRTDMQLFPMSYRLIRALGRPIFAYPVGSRSLRLAAINRYQPFTWRRKLLAVAMRAAIRAGLDNIFTTPYLLLQNSDMAEILAVALERVKSIIPTKCEALALMWPRQDLRARIYIHLLGIHGKPIAFCKIAKDDDEAFHLRHEIEALRDIAHAKLRTFKIPRILSVFEVNRSFIVLYEPLPSASRSVRLPLEDVMRIIGEYGGPIRNVSGEVIRGCLWYKSAIARRDELSSSFIEGIVKATANEVPTRRAHGDLGLGNICVDGNDVWVYDWEGYSCDAPAFVDELSYRLSFYFRRLHSNPRDCWNLVALARRESNAHPTEGDMLLAVAFLANKIPAYAELIRMYPGIGIAS